MFKTTFMAAAMLLSVCAHAQYSISGKVTGGKSNLALAGATLQIEGSKRFAVTDEFGSFAITRVVPGEYLLITKFLGYETHQEKVNITGNTEVSINLEEAVQLTDEVVVTATRATDKSPTTFSNVSRQSIEKQNFGQDLPLLLNWTPSVVTTSDAGTGIGYTGMRIRGSDATRINVTINGIPYNDSESQGTFWVDIPDVASSTQSIQIQRGVGTSTNGGSAFGGSVNLQTNSLQADPYAEGTLAFGSFATQRYTLRAGTGLINNHWAFDGKVSKILSDGYVDRASSDLGSYYISGGYYGNKTIIKAITFGGQEETYQSWYGLDAGTMKTNRTMNYAGAIYDADGNIIRYYDKQVDHYRQDHYQLHVSQQLHEFWNVNASLHYTYGRGYYEEYQQGVAFADVGLPSIVLKDTTMESSDLITRKWLDNKFYGATFSIVYDKEKTNLTIGGAFNQYGHAKHYGEIIWAQYAGNIPTRYHYYDGESQKNDFNIYTKWNYAATALLNVFADVQYRYVGYKTSGVESHQENYAIHEQFNFFNPKAGVSYSLSDHDVLYSSYAIANREPNRTDYLDSDVKPKSEHLENLEVGWRRGSTRYNLEANYYWMNYTNQLVLTGKLDNVGNPVRANVGKSYRTGVELSGAIRFSKHWSWNVNLTLNKNVNKDFVFTNDNNELVKKNTSITLSPDVIGGSQLSCYPFENFEVTLLCKYVGKQYLDNTENENTTLDAYFVNDLRLKYGIHPKGMKSIDFSLLLNNLLNAEYSSNGYSYYGTPYYYPQAGRNFMAMVTVKF